MYGGYAEAGNAAYNTVNIFGGTFSGEVYGAFAAGNATYNNVSISGGTFDGGVHGGYSSTAGGATTHNTVTLIGGSNAADRTGNTLNLHGYLGSVGEINNFANYSVILSDSVTGGGTQIHITGSTPTDLSGARITDFSFAPGTTHYESDRVNIIDSTYNDGTFQDVTFKAVPKGATATYDVHVSGTGGALAAEIGQKKSGDHSESINEERYADVALLSKGSYLLSRTALDRAWQSEACTEGGTMSVFGVSDYGDYTIDGGMDLNGWSLLTGLGWRNKRDCTTGLLLGAFFEAGHGRYDGGDFYADTGAVDYFGTTKYHGGGILVRYCFANRLCLDGSIRVGRQEMEYRATRYPGNQLPEYDLASNYLGFHGGIGYDIDFAERWNLDLSAMYQWIRLGSDSATILGEYVYFDSVQSHLVRAGSRLSYAVTPQVKPFVGAYYEYEFDGLSRSYNRTANLANRDFNSKGGSGLGEVGVGFVPSRNRDLVIELSAKGSVGKNEGIGGQVSFNWNF